MLSRSLPLGLVAALFASVSLNVRAQQSLPSTVQGIISQYGLTQQETLPQPSKAMDSNGTVKYVQSNWDLNKNKIQAGPQDLSFVDDPFDSSSSDAVLAVKYGRGSYGGDGTSGGAQFYSQPLSSSSSGSRSSNASFGSMLLEYEVAFDQGFQFNKGGKLPGLRGGDAIGCSGGTPANGLTCYSARLMFRTGGAGEVYAYIPTPNNLCSSSDVLCNDEYGTSLSRGSFTFPAGAWSKVQLFVQMNSPDNVANGRIVLFFNDKMVAKHENLQIRAADAVANGGMFFSTFFGGSDVSWASQVDQSSYFRNIRMSAGSAVSDASGSTVKSGSSPRAAGPASSLSLWVSLGLVALVALTR